MAGHALLSPSSSERWINCPPSAKENVGGDTGSTYAQQGTDAHTLCEYKVKKALGFKVRDPTDDLEYFDEEMAECTDAYCEFVMEQVQAAKETCADPLVLVEQRLDFTRWVAESFGTADCIVVADGVMTVIDFKYGLGVLVEAEGNSQMRMYALGALNLFESLYDPFEKKLMGVTAMTKLLGAKKFNTLLGSLIEKPKGKPTLVPESDKRPAWTIDDFKEETENE